ncbi:MAG: hypothetical protein AAGF11_46775 [Myxococcota bacterium]
MPRPMIRAALGPLGLTVLLAVGCARAAGPGARAPQAEPGGTQGSAGSAEARAARGFARGARSADVPADSASGLASGSTAEQVADPAAVLAEAEAALSADDGARAVALLGRVLQHEGALSPAQVASAWMSLARAHEKLRDCLAAIRAYETYLSRFAEGEHVLVARARRGACEAELERWEESATTFHAIAELPEQLPSVQVEALAREGYALYMLDRLEPADARLARADAIYEQAVAEQTERFSSYYFIGMARFYRAAILHRKFRDVEIRLPEAVMEEGFKAKLELLIRAQDAYNHTIKAKHMFWVSAAGFQLGHLFSELYDALMYAPVPEWLDERQREVYFEELKTQLRPVVTKAIWVFEKNLETARRLGYDNDFIQRTEAKLGHLQAIMLSEDASLGQPNQRLAREDDEQAVDAPAAAGDGTASDRKLFVPRPTAL